MSNSWHLQRTLVITNSEGTAGFSVRFNEDSLIPDLLKNSLKQFHITENLIHKLWEDYPS